MSPELNKSRQELLDDKDYHWLRGQSELHPSGETANDAIHYGRHKRSELEREREREQLMNCSHRKRKQWHAKEKQPSEECRRRIGWIIATIYCYYLQ